MATKAEQRAKNKYNKKVYKQIQLRFRKDTEKDLIEKLESEPSINAYIKNLIKKDLN